MSSRIGSPDVGMPAASGFGVNTGVTAPNGATLCIEGSEQRRSPSARARSMRFSVRREAGDVVRAADRPPCRCRMSRGHRAAASKARSVSHGPGRRPPSHGCAAGARVTTAGSPDVAIVALLDLGQIAGRSSARPCVVWPSRSPSTRTAATSRAMSSRTWTGEERERRSRRSAAACMTGRDAAAPAAAPRRCAWEAARRGPDAGLTRTARGF